MRTVILEVLAIIISFSVTMAGSFAAAPEVRQNYVDADNDGVCDYYDNNCSYADNNGICNGNGICNDNSNCITAPNCGRYFTDTNEDGICDNHTSQQGTGNRHGHGFRGGHCR